jgi:hypothetical protein
MVVYVVVRFWWEDHEIVGVFNDRADAERELEAQVEADLKQPAWSRWGFGIEEHELR